MITTAPQKFATPTGETVFVADNPYLTGFENVTLKPQAVFKWSYKEPPEGYVYAVFTWRLKPPSTWLREAKDTDDQDSYVHPERTDKENDPNICWCKASDSSIAPRYYRWPDGETTI